MGTAKEYGIKMRQLRLVKMLIDMPFQYNKKQLAQRLDVSEDTIKTYVSTLRNAEFNVKCDNRYRYGFEDETTFKQLKDLLHFTEKDQETLREAIEQMFPSSKKGERLKKKLSSIYDYQRLGHAFLRKPYLEKIDLLRQAEKEKRQVLLEGYRSSNSNKVSTRHVEPFHASAEDDILHAYDLEKQALRHFRISRIERIQLLDTNWASSGFHHIIATDPFRIVDNHQIMVHLRLKVGAYNELMERFPKTEYSIKHDAERDIYDFQCKVNHQFYGLTNFILGYHHQLVEIVYPDELKEHIANELEKIRENLDIF